MKNPLIPPPVVVAIVASLMWLTNRTLGIGQFDFVWLRPLSVALLIVSLLLMAYAVASFVAVKTTVNPLRPARASSLVTTGIFKFSRNPIYLGDLLMLAAFSLWLGNVVNLAFLMLFVAYINRFQIVPEERALTQLFGENYIAYCARVRRWL
ncbi:MAG: isoprenylcysteine carboxylmethyltransferase family protein [Undibacterium sp.]|uniref:methyltransferase family protein n=1 Tax=Undibacterium sp. TaxID=1914977 RepID=UPI0027263738|nr:isoprenylcysteine carboxylmethyltransferase family protein [Undibacterium sp.]MDO8652231.1 isoprenylcysteine carboxylmethyltransferase family protein [Undibacterium sp.]